MVFEEEGGELFLELCEVLCVEVEVFVDALEELFA